MVKRNEGVAAEYSRIAESLQTLTTVSADTYAADTGDLLGLNMGLNAVAKHYGQSQALLEDESRAWDEGVLEDLKRQRDGLVSVRDMFERQDRYDRDNIPQLEKRIKQNEEKLVGIRAKPAELVKPGEAERVEDAIQKVLHVAPFPQPCVQCLQETRTSNQLSTNMHAASSLKNVFVMKSCISNLRNTTFPDCSRIGLLNGSSMQNCRLRTGARSLMRWRACHWARADVNLICT